MSDLKVQYDTLQDSQHSLETVKGEFEHCTERRERAADAWGSSAIGDAMHDFTDNWDRHRKKLVGSILALQEMTGACIDTFRAADAQLAAAFDKARVS